jgi:hypothetical protein
MLIRFVFLPEGNPLNSVERLIEQYGLDHIIIARRGPEWSKRDWSPKSLRCNAPVTQGTPVATLGRSVLGATRMKQSTRALIAAAAAEKITARPVERVFDHTTLSAVPVSRHLSMAERTKRKAAIVLYVDSQERVSLRVRDDLFVGFDHGTGAYFAGAMYESDVMLFDSSERRYYRFHVHQGAPALLPLLAHTPSQGVELQEV